MAVLQSIEVSKKCTSLIIDGGDKTIGRNDENYRLAEKYSTDAEIYAEIQEAAYSTSVIETMINDGYLLGYVDQLKAEGWIPQDFTPAGSKSSNSNAAQTETKAETPADNQTATSETKRTTKNRNQNRD